MMQFSPGQFVIHDEAPCGTKVDVLTQVHSPLDWWRNTARF
ncbi:hypothetical protein ACLB1R_35840 [Escherichia coli]